MATRRETSKDAILKLRVKSDVLEHWRGVAGEQGLSEWARQVLGEEAGTLSAWSPRSDRWYEVAKDATRRLRKLDVGALTGSKATSRRQAKLMRELAKVATDAADLLERRGYTRPL